MVLDRFFLRKVSPIVVFTLLTSLLFAQYTDVTPRAVNGRQYLELQDKYSSADIFEFDLAALTQATQSKSFNNAVRLDLPGLGEYKFSLVKNHIYSTDMVIRVQTENGVEVLPSPEYVKTFKGYTARQNLRVRFTIDHNFINGFIETDDGVLYFEQLNRFVKGAPANLVIAHFDHATLEEGQYNCNTVNFTKVNSGEEDGAAQRAPGDCYEVEVAFANDYLMFDDHGGVSGVENHNIAVMNNVAANYDDEFEEDMEFDIVEIFVSTCSSCDPWTSSTAAGELLDSFRDWAVAGGFSVAFDMADLWTDRNLNGATIGLAWVSGVCFTNWKYCITQDFTGNAQLLRVLLAHEFGHLFGALHDPSGSNTIMAPSVNTSSSWSDNSIDDINDFIDGINCLGPCPASIAPEAGLSSDITEGCSPLTVQFFDASDGVVDDWFWTFEGGNPSTSTETDPEVTFDDPGTYDVTLEVSNSVGATTITLEDYITVHPDPIAEFTYTANELQISFLNLSQFGDEFEWDFGDGSSSNEMDPVHWYVEDGAYEVTLTVTNECGTDVYILLLDVISIPIADFTYDPATGCEPLIVNFYNESSPNATEFYWEFDGGTPSISYDEFPVVEYELPGTYSVLFIASNAAGDDVLTLNNIITVDPLPTAGFDYTVNGMTAQFVSSAQDENSIQWEFGDGNTSGIENPSHTYATGGTYTVLQIVDNNCGSDTMIQVINVNGPPNAGMSVNISTGCAPLTVTYMSTSSGEVDTYEWSFPGGSPSTSNLEEPEVTYNLPGTYSAELIVTNSVGSDTVEINDVVVVQEETTSDFSYDVDGNILDVTNESTGETSILWIIDGEEYTQEQVTVVFTMDGVYEVILIATGPCGSDTSEVTITIATPPTAGFETSGPQTGCEPFTVEFMNTSSPNATGFEWSFPGGTPASSTEENPVVVYDNPGTYSVTLVATSAGGTDEMVMQDFITVDPLPEAAFNTIQTGTEIKFQNSSQDADTYLWVFGDGDTATGKNPKHDYGAFGVYDVMLIAYNDCGTDTAFLTLELAELPVPVFEAEANVGCAPFEVHFIDMSQNGAESWEWSFPGGTPEGSTEQNPVVVYNEPGVYDVTLKVFNAAGSQALVRQEYIQILPEPVSEFGAEVDGDKVEFMNMSDHATSYFWDFGDGSTDTTANPTHVYPGTGTYNVMLVATNFCSSDTFYLDVNVVSTAVYTPVDKARHELWPNPNNGTFTFELSIVGEVTDLQVVNVTGTVVWTKVVEKQPAGSRMDVDLNVPAGVYYLIQQSAKDRIITPFIVQD